MGVQCLWHLCQNPARRKFCSDSCKAKFYVARRRKDLKVRAVAYMGGACRGCGYDRCVNALQFHHRVSGEKDFGISNRGHTRSWDRIKKELDKCVLVCSNCHSEIHAGDRDLPA